MGQIFQVTGREPINFRTQPGTGVINPTERPGCWIEVTRAKNRVVTTLCLLELDLLSPLTPRTREFKQLFRKDDPPDLVLRLENGIWWCSVDQHPEYYLVANGDSLRIVTRAQAYCGIGAVEQLKKMGLEDAAIALSAGQFDLASVQVIAERDRRAGKS